MESKQEGYIKQIFVVIAILLVVILIFSIGWFFNSITNNACQICGLKQNNTTQSSISKKSGERNPEGIVDGKFVKYEDGSILLDSDGNNKKIKVATSTSFVKVTMESPKDEDYKTKKITKDDLKVRDSISIMLKPGVEDKIAQKVRKITIKQ